MSHNSTEGCLSAVVRGVYLRAVAVTLDPNRRYKPLDQSAAVGGTEPVLGARTSLERHGHLLLDPYSNPEPEIGCVLSAGCGPPGSHA